MTFGRRRGSLAMGPPSRRVPLLVDDHPVPSERASIADGRYKHVERQFETAYPGALRFDVQGRMERPLAEITPSEVRVRAHNLYRLRRGGFVRPDRRKVQAVTGITAKPFDASGG